MGATQVSKPPAEPVARVGTVELDRSSVNALREYVLAAAEHRRAKERLDAARVALDAVAGTGEAATYGGVAVWSYASTARRSVDVDRLALRHPDAYADVTTESTSYRLTIPADVRQAMQSRTWRAALARRVADGPGADAR